MIKERNLLSKVVNHLLKKEYTIIIGARQTGKTTLLKQLFQICKNNGDSCYFLSFEDFTILNSVNQHPENIFKFVEKTFDNQFTKRLFLFIDEIQYASNPTNFLKYLYDIYEEKIKIVATGSSAFYIDKRFTDSLAGRKRIFHLKQLNFSEYLHFRNADELQNELKLLRNNEDYISIKRNDISYFFEEYLCFGSYPAVVLENDREEKIEILKDLKNSFLKKDISEAGVLYEHKFLQLMVLLAEQIGNLVNKNELANTLGIDNKTIENYLNIMQQSFHISLVPPFNNNLRKEITKMPKIYFHDLGLRNALLNRFENFVLRNDKGALLENYAYIRFVELYGKDNVYFWRTANQNEVDFVAKHNNIKSGAYEIKYSEKNINQNKYKIFNELYPEIPLTFITYETTDNLISKSILNL